MSTPPIPTMIASLRHLMGTDDNTADFVFPSLLREVPSVTLPHTDYRGAMSENGELGGSAGRNSLRAAPGTNFI